MYTTRIAHLHSQYESVQKSLNLSWITTERFRENVSDFLCQIEIVDEILWEINSTLSKPGIVEN